MLRPVARLQQVVCLEKPVVCPMRICFKHGRRVEVPYRCPRHNVETIRSKYGKVDGCVDLLHKAGLFSAGADAEVDCQRADEALHEEFPRKGENNDVEGHEGEVTRPFAILCRCIWAADGVDRYQRVGGREGVGEEYGAVEGVGRGRLDEVGGEDGGDEDEGIHPCVSKREVFPPAEEAAGFSTLGDAGDFGLGVALVRGSAWRI